MADTWKTNPVRSSRRALKLLGSVFAVLGLGLLAGAGWSGNRQYMILTTWPTVEAEVTKSQVTHHISHDSRHNTDTTMYQAKIEFHYMVENKEFTTPSTPGYSTSSYTSMKHMADVYAPGTRHPIRYNPADPNDIRFNAGYTFGFFFLPVLLGGMGIGFGGVGGGLLYGASRLQQLLCPSCGQPVERSQHFCPNCAAPLQVA